MYASASKPVELSPESSREIIMNSNSDSAEQVPDVTGLIFRAAHTDHEMDAILECRWKGYRRYGFEVPTACRDSFDKHAIQYVCQDEQSKRILGCLRLLPIHHRPFELEEYCDISGWARNGTRPAELTRFSIPISKRLIAIKWGLWKLAFFDACKSGHSHFLICTAEYTKQMYESLGFVPYPGDSCDFLHATLRNTPHVAMILNLSSVADLYRREHPGLYRFCWEVTHSNIFSSMEAA